MLQVPGDAMGPAVTYRGTFNVCLRNLDARGTVGCAGAEGPGGVSGVAGSGAVGRWRADAVGTKSFLDYRSDFSCSHGGIG